MDTPKNTTPSSHRLFRFDSLPEHVRRNVAAGGSRGRKARWALRHAIHRHFRRRHHPGRKLRAAQRFVRHWDLLQQLGGKP